jgi:hypothetical protein
MVIPPTLDEFVDTATQHAFAETMPAPLDLLTPRNV